MSHFKVFGTSERQQSSIHEFFSIFISLLSIMPLPSMHCFMAMFPKVHCESCWKTNNYIIKLQLQDLPPEHKPP